MMKLHITSAQFIFSDFSGLSEDLMLGENSFAKDAKKYADDFIESFRKNARDIIFADADDGRLLNTDTKIIISLSGQFNIVTFSAVPENANNPEPVELHRTKLFGLIPRQELDNAAESVIIYFQVAGVADPSTLEMVDNTRSAIHNIITENLTSHTSKHLPGLLKDHEKEERALAGVIRSTWIARNFRRLSR